MPVAIVAREPGSIGLMTRPALPSPISAISFLKPSRSTACPGLAKVFVNDMHALMRPAEIDGAVDETILQLGTFLMMPHLVYGRLANVDIGQLAAMLAITHS
ncbi:hypothetical protein [Mesorhizobium sp. M1365]|uniref:hypothetical protein n=1 Tax=Mesorhizobium sp. M1365 TaxID=2957090 RepID=UPI003339B138